MDFKEIKKWKNAYAHFFYQFYHDLKDSGMPYLIHNDYLFKANDYLYISYLNNNFFIEINNSMVTNSPEYYIKVEDDKEMTDYEFSIIEDLPFNVYSFDNIDRIGNFIYNIDSSYGMELNTDKITHQISLKLKKDGDKVILHDYEIPIMIRRLNDMYNEQCLR